MNPMLAVMLDWSNFDRDRAGDLHNLFYRLRTARVGGATVDTLYELLEEHIPKMPETKRPPKRRRKK